MMRRNRIYAAAAAALLLVPALALASSGGSEHPWRDVALKFVNFGILVGGFIYLLRKAVPDALRGRRETIERELREAREAKAAADAKLAEYKGRVANLEAEIEKIRTDFKTEGDLQFKRILAEAEQAAETIRRNAAAAGEREGRQAAEQLRTEAVEQALALAAQILAKAYGEADQKTALQKTIEKIEGLH